MEKTSQHPDYQLNEFRKNHPVRKIKVAGNEWNYIVSGKGKNTILIIHGGTGSSESIFRYVTALGKKYKVIAPTIPTHITTTREAITGIEMILKNENVTTAHLIGFSMGGMLEQIFVRKHPNSVKTLVLFHCPPPSKSYAKKMQRTLRLTRILPEFLLKFISKYGLKREFKKYSNIPKREKNFWVNYYLRNVSKMRIVNNTKLVIDYLENSHFSANDLSEWKGKILIFETATDTRIPKIEREEIKRLYKRAQVHTFTQGDHLGNGIFLFNTTISIINQFLVKNT